MGCDRPQFCVNFYKFEASCPHIFQKLCFHFLNDYPLFKKTGAITKLNKVPLIIA